MHGKHNVQHTAPMTNQHQIRETNTHAPCHLLLIPTLLLRIVPHVARRVVISTRAINARWSNIVMQHVKRNIDQSIRKHVRDEWLNYTMKLYSKNIHLVKSVQYAFYPYQLMQDNQLSNHVVVKLSVKGALLR